MEINKELIKLFLDKGYKSKTLSTVWVDKTISENKEISISQTVWYSWMCEVQKWLRSTHGISLLIDLDITINYIYEISSLHPKSSYKGGDIQSDTVWMSYEQALEQGLIDVEKLIQ